MATIAALTEGGWAPEISAYAQTPMIITNCQSRR